MAFRINIFNVKKKHHEIDELLNKLVSNLLSVKKFSCEREKQDYVRVMSNDMLLVKSLH